MKNSQAKGAAKALRDYVENSKKNDFHAISFVRPCVEVGQNLFSVFSIKLLLPQRRIPRAAADALPLSLSLTHIPSFFHLIFFFFVASFALCQTTFFRRGTK